jgi:hypothetical protein
MSLAAIAQRLDEVAELYELWKFLRTGKRVAHDQQNTRGSSYDKNPLG